MNGALDEWGTRPSSIRGNVQIVFVVMFEIARLRERRDHKLTSVLLVHLSTYKSTLRQVFPAAANKLVRSMSLAAISPANMVRFSVSNI